MNRRHFLACTALGSAALYASGASASAAEQANNARQKEKMKAGHQGHSSDADLRVLAALGVSHICSALPSRTLDDN